MTTTPQPQPIEKPNVNLERSVGGSPGFINISRYMCVGNFDDNPTGGIDETQAVSSLTQQYSYACGHYHPLAERAAADSTSLNGTSVPNLYQPGLHPITDTMDTKCCDDCDSGPGTGPGGWSGTVHEYIERDTNELRRIRMNNKHALIPKGIVRSRDPELKVRTAFIFKHPRMEIDELKYFGVQTDDRVKIQSVASGEQVKIFNFGCNCGQRQTLSVAFFKKDLGTIVVGDKIVPDPSGSGKQLHQYKVLSQIVPTTGLNTHSASSLNYYTFAVMVWSNGGNKGNEPVSMLGQTAVLEVPQAPFWDDDTVMVVMIGPNGNGGSKRKSTTVTSITNNGTPNWFNGRVGNNFSLFLNESDANQINCRINYRIERFTETFFGCSQLRDVEWQLTNNGNASGNDQLWNVPESGRHVMKLVSSDYYDRDCTNRISSAVVVDQDSVIYASNCKENIGDPRVEPFDPQDPNKVRSGYESFNGKHHIEKCMSYSMNVNPRDRRINTNKCCSPKISGPFLLDSREFFKKIGVNEKIYDSPYTKENELGNRPDLSLFNNHFRYLLRNRIDCECNSSECGINPCYSCTTRNKNEFESCLTRTQCVNNNCCSDPCIGCPTNYDDCIANTSCASKGCCSLCTNCEVRTVQDYNNCINDVGSYALRKCNESGCCNFPCSTCAEKYEDCILNPQCVANGCCSIEGVDCETGNGVNGVSNTILDYFSCRTGENITKFGTTNVQITRYKDILNSQCCSNNLCSNAIPSECFDALTDGLRWSDNWDSSANIPKREKLCYLLFQSPSIPSNRTTTDGQLCSSACPTNTVKDYVNCLMNNNCSKNYSRSNSCCRNPCTDACLNRISDPTLITEVIDGVSVQRSIASYDECMEFANSQCGTDCCNFWFEKPDHTCTLEKPT